MAPLQATLAYYAMVSIWLKSCCPWVQGEPQRCMHQEEALRPFGAVLRGATRAEAREAAVTAVAEAVTVHARGLGSGARGQNMSCHLCTSRAYMRGRVDLLCL